MEKQNPEIAERTSKPVQYVTGWEACTDMRKNPDARYNRISFCGTEEIKFIDGSLMIKNSNSTWSYYYDHAMQLQARVIYQPLMSVLSERTWYKIK